MSATSLPEAPAKTTDRRGDWRGGTVQCEALSPDVLAGELESAIRSVLDLGIYQRVLDAEAAERAELTEEVTRMLEAAEAPRR